MQRKRVVSLFVVSVLQMANKVPICRWTAPPRCVGENQSTLQHIDGTIAQTRARLYPKSVRPCTKVHHQYHGWLYRAEG